MTRKQFERHERISRRIVLVLAFVLMLHMTITTIRGNVRQQKEFEAKEREWQQQQEEYEKNRTEQDALIEEAMRWKAKQEATGETQSDKYAVFDTMSKDWGGEEQGFVFYDIPQEYKDAGGYFPEEMQIYTYCLCKQEGVSYPLIVAMIEHESGYQYDQIGDNGKSFGYMQINKAANEEAIGNADLLNPYQNVRIGITLMKELIDKYGTVQDALAAYNYGEAGAKRHLWSNGVYLYGYNESIIARMKEIREEVQE